MISENCFHKVDKTWVIESWWRQQVETFSALLALCAGNSPVSCEFPAQRPVMRSFDVSFELRLNKWLSIQSRGWWFETLSRSWCRHCNEVNSYGAQYDLFSVQIRTRKVYHEYEKIAFDNRLTWHCFGTFMTLIDILFIICFREFMCYIYPYKEGFSHSHSANSSSSRWQSIRQIQTWLSSI